MVVKREKSRSDVQQGIEKYVLENLGDELKAVLIQGYKLEKTVVDGYCCSGNEIIIVEVSAHIGKLKAGQRKKVLTDLFKMAYLKRIKEKEGFAVKCLMVFVDEDAASAFSDKTWGHDAADSFGIEMKVVKIPAIERSHIVNAQKEQDVTAR